MSKPVAVITGASKGIGEATAEIFLREGYKVYNLSRSGGNPEKGDNEDFLHIACDVSHCEQVDFAIEKIISETGRIDVAVSNAGMGISGSVEGATYEMIEKQIKVNFAGSAYFAKAVVPHIRKSKGRLIFLSSVAGLIPIPFQALYSATKAAIASLAMALDNEIKSSGARVCAVLPGDLATNFTSAREKNPKEASFYEKRVRESVTKMEQDEMKGKGPEFIGRRIFRMATERNPKVISTAGLFYKFALVLVKLLPVRAANYLIGRLYG